MNPDIEWSTKEKLAIASYVFHTGDQHWTGSVSRLLRPLGEADRPPEWFSPKNCAQQYTALAEAAETCRRKRSERSDSTDSISSTLQLPTQSISEIIHRKVTQERIEELKKLIRNERSKYKKIHQTLDKLKSGELNKQIDEMYDDMQQEQEKHNTSETMPGIVEASNLSADAETEIETSDQTDALDALSKQSQLAGELHKPCTSKTSSNIEEFSSEEKATRNAEVKQLENNDAPTFFEKMDVVDVTDSPTAKVDLQCSPLEKEDTISSATSSRTLPTPTPVIESDSCDEDDPPRREKDEDAIDPSEVRDIVDDDVPPTKTTDDPVQPVAAEPPTSRAEPMVVNVESPHAFATTSMRDTLADDAIVENSNSPRLDVTGSETTENNSQKVAANQDLNIFEQMEKADLTDDVIVANLDNPVDHVLAQLKEENVSQESEIGSPVADDDEASYLQSTHRKLTNRKRCTFHNSAPRKNDVLVEKSSEKNTAESIDYFDDSQKLKSEATSGDDNVKVESFVREETKENEVAASPGLKVASTDYSQATASDDDHKTTDDDKPQEDSFDYGSSVSSSTAYIESYPSSPALSTASDFDPEATAQSRAWKKSVMILWKQVASHKYASVFLQPVTNDIAPNYSSIVLRPMDLSTLKKNVESGLVRTTSEFQRDLMLMFQNALMYNNSEHDVYKMTEDMQKDVMDQVTQFLATQLMMETTKQLSTKGLRRSTLRKSMVVEKGNEPRGKRSIDTDLKTSKDRK